MSHFHRTFKATRTEYNGRLYDSKHEAKRAMQLDLLKRAGEVAWWIPQVTIQLGPDHCYRVDFLVAEWASPCSGVQDVRVRAEDAKLVETREFARHRRMWKKYGPFDLHIVKRKGVIEVVEGGRGVAGVSPDQA